MGWRSRRKKRMWRKGGTDVACETKHNPPHFQQREKVHQQTGKKDGHRNVSCPLRVPPFL